MSYTQKVGASLAKDVINGATFTVPYPLERDDGLSYAGMVKARIEGELYLLPATFNANDITITNTTGLTLPKTRSLPLQFSPVNPGELIVLDTQDYGVVGDGVTECYSALAAAIAAAELAMASSGRPVELILPPGDIKITNTAPLDFTSGYFFRVGNTSSSTPNALAIPSMRGAGRDSTRLRPQVAGQALFRVYNAATSNFIDTFVWQDFSIYGPGSGNSETVGIQIGGVNATRSDVSGNATFRNILIAFCGTAIRLDDATNDLFEQIYTSGCAYGVELGYNIDNCTFSQCQFQGDIATPVNSGVGIACGTWTPPWNTTPGNGNATRVEQCLFSLLTNCLDLQRVDESNFEVHGGYSERINKFAKLGVSATIAGLKQFIVDGHHFSQAATATVGLTSAAIEIIGTGGAVDPHLTIRNCRSDQTPTQQWILGATQAVGAGQGHLIWDNNIGMSSSHANGAVTWADANVTPPFSAQGRLEIGKGVQMYNANTPLGTTPMQELRLRQGAAGKTYTKWTPVDAANAQAGSDLSITNLDAAGAAQLVTLKGAIIPQGNNSVARPAASATYRGLLWVTFSAGGVADTADVCLKSAADTYSWKTMATG